MEGIGKKKWAIPEGYIPASSIGSDPEMTSHETACILNASDRDAHVEIMLFFSDREPDGPHLVTVPARRTRHLRFDELSVPKGIDYASLFVSDVPIVVQHTRLDSRQEANALLSTMAFAAE